MNQRGHTLVELMVASGLIVFAMLAFATMITQQRSSYVHIQQAVEATAAGNRIQDYLSQNADCGRALIGLDPNAEQDIVSLKNAAGTPVFWTDNAPGANPPVQTFGGSIFIDRMILQAGPAPIAPNSSGVVYFKTVFKLTKETAGGELRPRSTILYVETDVSGRISTCSSKTTNSYNCRVETKQVNGTYAVARCDQPWEQVISCAVEDNNISESNPNYQKIISGVSGGPAVPLILSMNPTDDAKVSNANPTTNYGGANLVANLGPPIEESYLKFVVDPLPAGSTINEARLYLYVTSGSTDGPRALRAGSGWIEGGVTYNTKPAVGAMLGDMGSISAGSWIYYDVTGFVTGALIVSHFKVHQLTQRHSIPKRELNYPN
jgi:type II secretory pathway pseudopilin PulG